MKKTMFIGIACGVVVMSLFISSFLSSQTSQNVLSAVSARFPQVFGKFRTQKWTLVATGDVIPARSVNYQMTVRNDFSWSIAGIADLLKSGDITLINLESPLIPDCPLTNEGMVFCGDQKFIESLTLAGVDVANLANNHSLNQGFEGLRETENFLNQNGIHTTGYTRDDTCAGQSWCSRKTILEIRGVQVGFLGYSTVGVTVDREALARDISSFDADVDLMGVSFHWGAEYTRVPRGFPDDPREIGHLAVNSGADVVIGNHPHWIQGLEYYQDKPIFYALGNTIFDQEWSSQTKEGIIAQLQFDGTKLTDIIITPIGIRHYGEAYSMEGTEKARVLQIFEEASGELAE